jgi:hypothetical protein
VKTIPLILLLGGYIFAAPLLDTFGITEFYPTKTGTREWNSAHWNNGIAREFKYAPDPYDPTDWTDDHSGGTDGFKVDGSGMMRMSGSGPRFHINSLITTKVTAQKFRDIEFTAYYRRLGTGGADWGGMVVGLRSGPLGHGSPGGNNCDATTYYGRFRDDGKWDFEKELNHPGSTYWSGSGYNTQDPLWHGAKLPVNRWIGMKYLTYNIQNNTQVKLLIYIDSVSNGTPQNGGHWEKVGEVIDAGSWPSGDVGGCGYPQTMVITEGGGTLLMRTDGDTADYKMVTVREIDPGAVPLSVIEAHGFRSNNVRYPPHGIQGLLSASGKKSPQKTPFALFDLQGRLIQGTLQPGAMIVPIFSAKNGIRLVTVGGKEN